MRSLILLLIGASCINGYSVSPSRRELFTKAVTAGTLATICPFLPANAVSGVNKVNAKLSGFGLPPVSKVPDGFQPLLEIYGKGKNRTPILVTFSYPITWVVTLPSNDVNGEDGTVQAGDYGKGDTATVRYTKRMRSRCIASSQHTPQLFVYEDAGKVGDITKEPKDLFENALQKCISQRGSNMYQNFKMTKLEPGTGSYMKGQSYMIADFKYQLLTGAGFEVDRKGVAAITSEGNSVQVLWAASTTNRFKKTEQTLRDIVGSFRCYAEGINFANDLYDS